MIKSLPSIKVKEIQLIVRETDDETLNTWGDIIGLELLSRDYKSGPTPYGELLFDEDDTEGD